jgi:hypothetical protein
MGQVQLLTDEVAGPSRQRIAEILEAVDRIRAIVARMRHLTRVELMDDTPGLPPMLDLRRSSELPADERSAVGDCLVIVARGGPAHYESLHRMFAGPTTEVIVDRRMGERRRAAADAAGGRRRNSRRQRDISPDLKTRGWALVMRSHGP